MMSPQQEVQVDSLGELPLQGLYGDYSYTFVTHSHRAAGIAEGNKCLETRIVRSSSTPDVTSSLLEFLNRMLSFSTQESHPNFLKVLSVQQLPCLLTASRRSDLILSHFYAEFESRLGSLRPRIRPPTLDQLVSFHVKTEYHGPTLYSMLKRAEKEEYPESVRSTQLQILHGLLEGVKFLHRQGIQHGHIDAHNVVFSGPRLQLPVQLAFLQEQPHSQGDMHALGVLFYQVLDYPWEISSNNRVESSFLWLSGKRPLRNRMILDGDSILMKMVEEEESKRFQSAEEIRIELDPGVVGEGIEGTGLDAIAQVLRQLKTPDGNEWYAHATFLTSLGQGSFGFVTASRNNRTGEVTAVKVLICTDQETEEVGDREYHNIKFTFHRNLVRTHQIREKVVGLEELRGFQIGVIGQDPEFASMLSSLCMDLGTEGSVKLLCLEMELCGMSLSQWLELERGTEDGQTKLLIVDGIIQGLSFLHSKDIIHRDLKPDNILFSFPGDSLPVKIGDFGLSRKLPFVQLPSAVQDDEGQNETLTTNIGTRAYRAPEVDKETYGKPADLYSFGFILFATLCRIPLSKRGRAFQKLKNKGYSVIQDHQANSIVSNGKELIISLTQEEVKDRIQSIEDIRLITIPAVLVPSDTFQLKTFLKRGGVGTRIEMGRVSVYKTSLRHRHDTFIVQWNFGKEGPKDAGAGYGLDAGCLIKGSEPDQLHQMDIKLIGVKTHKSEDLAEDLCFRSLYVNFQEEKNCPDVMKGCKSPGSIRVSETLEFSGVPDLNATVNNLMEGVKDGRKVVVVVEVFACVLPLKGVPDDGTILTLGDLQKTHWKVAKIEGNAHILLL